MATVRQQANQKSGNVKEIIMIAYFRITMYSPEYDTSMILDAYGRYEKKCHFLFKLVELGHIILDVFDLVNTTDADIKPLQSPIPEKICTLRSRRGNFNLTRLRRRFSSRRAEVLDNTG